MFIKYWINRAQIFDTYLTHVCRLPRSIERLGGIKTGACSQHWTPPSHSFHSPFRFFPWWLLVETFTWSQIYCVFKYIYTPLIDKYFCESQKVSVECTWSHIPYLSEYNASSNLMRTPNLKSIFGQKWWALDSRKYGIYKFCTRIWWSKQGKEN